MAALSQWRTSYVPGEWVVLCGPTSLVVMQPFAQEWSSLINTLWEEVLASSTIVELADRLAAFRIGEMPSFGAFFWTADGMRSLLRGAVTAKDLESGAIVADGTGIQTWSEVGLGSLAGLRIELPTAEPEGGMELPLLVGAVRASTVTLDARESSRMSSPQGAQGSAGLAPPVAPTPEADAAAKPQEPAQPVEGVRAGLDEPTAVDPLAEMEDASTELMDLPPSAFGQRPGQPTEDAVDQQAADQLPADAPATLVLSDGTHYLLDRRIRIGRAPSLEGVGPSRPHPGDSPQPDADELQLVTVSSPHQDISRSHLDIAPRNGQVVVTDLHSTNGTFVLHPGAKHQRERLIPAETVAVPIGSVLELGDGVSVSIEPSHSARDQRGPTIAAEGAT